VLICVLTGFFPRPYALNVNSQNADVPKFASLLLLANKYGYREMEKWALDILEARLETDNMKSLRLQCEAETMEKLLRLSICVGSKGMTAKVETIWFNRLERASKKTLSCALDVIESLGLRQFLGKLYYMAMVDLAREQSSQGKSDTYIANCVVPSIEEVLKDMSSLHITRITSGFFKFSVMGERIVSEVLSISPPSKTFKPDTISALADIPACDVFKRLELMEKHYREYLSQNVFGFNHNLAETRRAQFMATESIVECDLASYFISKEPLKVHKA
jgi:hypothetical protein